MKTNLPHTAEVRLKAYSITELAEFYECSLKTMKTWLENIKEELGERMGHFYTPKQVRIIFEEFGVPLTMILNCELEQ